MFGPILQLVTVGIIAFVFTFQVRVAGSEEQTVEIAIFCRDFHTVELVLVVVPHQRIGIDLFDEIFSFDIESGHRQQGFGRDLLLHASLVTAGNLGLQFRIAIFGIVKVFQGGEAHLAGVGGLEAGPFTQIVGQADQVRIIILVLAVAILPVGASTEDHTELVHGGNYILHACRIELEVFFFVHQGRLAFADFIPINFPLIILEHTSYSHSSETF